MTEIDGRNDFDYNGRRFSITSKDSCEKGVEFIQLSESITSRNEPTEHLVTSDGILRKIEPIMFASRSANDPDIQISMQYEGLPLDVVRHFVEFVEKTWK